MDDKWIKYCVIGKVHKEDIVRYYICNLFRELNIHRLSSKCVDIEFVDAIDDDAQGIAIGDKDDVSIKIARTSCEAPLSFLNQMQTLAHEMVHTKQFLRGELGYDLKGNFKWKKECMEGKKYSEQPWEKEAISLERSLFLKCFPFDTETTEYDLL
ncbi:hypothetical protein N9112_02745 [bacterium]|nr:hypothetical protein [bacterium]